MGSSSLPRGGTAGAVPEGEHMKVTVCRGVDFQREKAKDDEAFDALKLPRLSPDAKQRFEAYCDVVEQYVGPLPRHLFR
jgi:hypothetical protein